MIPILIVLIIFGTAFGFFYVYFTTRNKERLVLIEKGADAKLFNTGSKLKLFGALATLKTGMFFAGIAIGILIGNVLAELTTLDDVASYFSMIFLFGGLSLIIFYFIAKNK